MNPYEGYANWRYEPFSKKLEAGGRTIA